jgi:hypothetical protein
VWLEGLGQLKNPLTSSGIKPATFQLVLPQPTTLPHSPTPSLNKLKINGMKTAGNTCCYNGGFLQIKIGEFLGDGNCLFEYFVMLVLTGESNEQTVGWTAGI